MPERPLQLVPALHFEEGVNLNIGIGTSREYILAMIALTGEAERTKLLESRWFSESRMLKVLRMLIPSHIYKYKSLLTNKIFFRLSASKGDSYLKEISSELYFHFGIMVGMTKYRYEVPDRRKERMEYCSLLISKFIGIGCSIDCIRLMCTGDSEKLSPAVRNRQIRVSDQNTVFNGDGSLRPMSEVMRGLRKEELAFFTTRVLSLEENGTSNPKANLTRTYGLFIKGSQAYMCYFISKPNFIMDVSTESAIRFDYKSNNRLPKLSNIHGPDGLFFTSDANVYTAYVARKNVEKRVCDPTKIFEEHAFVLPFDHPMTDSILRLIAEDGYSEKFNKGFFAEGTSDDEEYDAFWNGGYWFDFILGDLNVLRRAKLFMRNNFESTFIACQEYQKTAVIEFLRLKTEDQKKHIVVIPDELIERNINNILEEETKNENVHADD